jgi:hypothetical protein
MQYSSKPRMQSLIKCTEIVPDAESAGSKEEGEGRSTIKTWSECKQPTRFTANKLSGSGIADDDGDAFESIATSHQPHSFDLPNLGVKALRCRGTATLMCSRSCVVPLGILGTRFVSTNESEPSAWPACTLQRRDPRRGRVCRKDNNSSASEPSNAQAVDEVKTALTRAAGSAIRSCRAESLEMMPNPRAKAADMVSVIRGSC